MPELDSLSLGGYFNLEDTLAHGPPVGNKTVDTRWPKSLVPLWAPLTNRF
jgi:hypothetical protein